jgi:hypothetical protein
MKTVRILKTLSLSVFAVLCAVLMSNTAAYNDFSEASFKRFVALFPSREVPYSVGANEMNAWIERRKKGGAQQAKPKMAASIADEYNDYIPEMSSGRFSRMGPDVFTPEAVLAHSAKQTILLYSRSRGYSERKGTQYLAVYSPKGKRLSEMIVAKSDGYEGFMGCKITKTQAGTLLVTTTIYANQWKNDKARYDDENFITAVTPKSSTTRMITASGEIEEIAQP